MPNILRIAIASPLRRLFDYLPPSEGSEGSESSKVPLQPGMRVRVPFGRREVIGLLWEVRSQTDVPVDKLKAVLAVLDAAPLLPDEIMALAKWVSDYYHYSIGEVLLSSLPVSLRKPGNALENAQKKLAKLPEGSNEILASPVTLNAHQEDTLKKIREKSKAASVFLLSGITGSGKTEVYLRVIADNLAQGKQALVLVPEISLTPQTIARFEQRFKVPIVALHSGLTNPARLRAWLQAAQNKAAIVIGTRSAVFTPMPTLGVVIVDEEHDGSFKQQSGLRYSARDLAVVRGQMANVPVILGTATPSLESLQNVTRKRYIPLSLPERAGDAVPPQVSMIDIRGQRLEEGLSNQLLGKMRTHLENEGQVLIFLNRRGYAPVLMCHMCGWAAECRRCDARLILHHAPKHLHCHHCDAQQAVPRHCPGCEQTDLSLLGVGTERLEEALQQHFPDIGIARIDRDTTQRKGAMEGLIDSIHAGENRILVGTQMLAKGHHFPQVTLAAILDADGGLLSADFRASERLGQLIVQVAGRAGRAERLGEVLIQTHHPEHPLLRELLAHGYEKYAGTLLAQRQASCLPPFAHLALLHAEGHQEKMPMDFLQEAKQAAVALKKSGVELLGPIVSPMARRAGRYRAQLLLQAPQRGALHQLLSSWAPHLETLKSARRVRWALDVDPIDTF